MRQLYSFLVRIVIIPAVPSVPLTRRPYCLAIHNSLTVNISEETPIRTAMGRLVIGRVEESGLLVIAGPNKSSELRWVNQRLAELGSSLILVDGALNRIAPMVETQGLIIATGASRTTDLDKLAAETRALANILNLPKETGQKEADLTVSSLLNEAMVSEFLGKLGREIKTVQVTGIIGENIWKMLAEKGLHALKGKTLIMTDPIKVLVAGTPDSLLEILEILRDNQTKITVAKSIHLLAITMNPFYPKYRYISHDYEPAYVDKHEMKRLLTRVTNLSVTDIIEDGVEKLWSIIDPQQRS